MIGYYQLVRHATSLLVLFVAGSVFTLECQAQYSKFRLYDFEEGTAGTTVTSAPDTLTDDFIPGTVAQTFTRTAGGFAGQPITGLFDFYDVEPLPQSVGVKEGLANGLFRSQLFTTGRAVSAPPPSRESQNPRTH